MAYADPERMREFANALWVFAQDSDNRANELSHQLSKLGDSWRDQEFEKFSAHFQRTRQKLQEFAEEIRGVVPALKSDADKLQEYLNINLNH